MLSAYGWKPAGGGIARTTRFGYIFGRYFVSSTIAAKNSHKKYFSKLIVSAELIL